MSVRRQYDYLSVIVRTKDGSRFLNVLDNDSSSMDYVQLAKEVNPDLRVDHFESSDLSDAREHIKTFDEKLEIQKFKFGVIYQKKGQVKSSKVSD